MHKMLASIAFVAMIGLACSAVAGENENIRHLDVSDGNSAGWVMFFSKAMAAKAPMGVIGTAVGTGDKFEGAFGMTVQSSKPTAAAIPESTIEDIRGSDKEPPATITILDVTAEQYASIKKTITEFSAIEKHEDSAVNVLLNFTFDVLKVTPLKKPFRSGLGAPNPVTYYEDIGLLNRKLAK